MKLFLDLPEHKNSYYEFGVDHKLHKEIVFCFGSNLAGKHGAGAALYAKLVFGAVYGQGEGLQGSSYAVPTKDIFLRSLPLYRVKEHVQKFKDFVKSNPDKYFFITPIGTGYAGIPHEDMAPLFRGLTNCWLPDIWLPFIEDDTEWN